MNEKKGYADNLIKEFKAHGWIDAGQISNPKNVALGAAGFTAGGSSERIKLKKGIRRVIVGKRTTCFYETLERQVFNVCNYKTTDNFDLILAVAGCNEVIKKQVDTMSDALEILLEKRYKCERAIMAHRASAEDRELIIDYLEKNISNLDKALDTIVENQGTW